jgi:hypothetical protein
VKTSRRKSLALAATGVVLATIAMLCWPELQYRQALPKYRFGATAETLKREIGTSIRLRKNGNYLPEDENELTKRRHFSYEHAYPVISWSLSSTTSTNSSVSRRGLRLPSWASGTASCIVCST